MTEGCLEELKRLAIEATPGPWEYHDGFVMVVLPDDKLPLARQQTGNNVVHVTRDFGMETCKANAAFIAAANPSVILNMIKSYQAKEEALYGVFVLVDKLRDMLKLQESGLEETIKAAIAMINRLEKEADWLAMELEKREHGCRWCVENKICQTSCGYAGPDNWREAARKAVEEKSEANSGTN